MEERRCLSKTVFDYLIFYHFSARNPLNFAVKKQRNQDFFGFSKGNTSIAINWCRFRKGSFSKLVLFSFVLN